METLNNDEEIKKIENIIKAYSYGEYNQHHLVVYDLTKDIGGYGDYDIILIKIEQEWDEKGAKYYLFLDHKAFVKVWELDNNLEITKEL